MTISIDDIQRDFVGSLRCVKAGETFVITEADRPVAEITPVTETIDQIGEQPRPFALCEGEFVVPDDFDALPLEEILSQFKDR